jgi:pimeloyl-ACP methyl ester carboxylesterase
VHNARVEFQFSYSIWQRHFVLEEITSMERRDFLRLSSGMLATLALTPEGLAKTSPRIDAAWYRRARRFVELPVSRVAYVEHGRGPAALFIHGYPLNGFQWRGALERLHSRRRCIAPDVMGMGYTQTPEGRTISPQTQAMMLATLLDALRVGAVDLVANDSGGLVAQLFLAKYPQRVRTLLLTNCDVDENSPPPQFVPFIEQARKGIFVDNFIVPQLKNKQLARSPQGMGGLAYTHPEGLTDETIETYFRPLVESGLKKAQVNEYAASMGTNSLIAIREELHRWRGPARMVWGLKDALFPVKWAEWLDGTLPGSHGVRRVEGANLFFPEEMPDLIAEEAARLWVTDNALRENSSDDI